VSLAFVDLFVFFGVSCVNFSPEMPPALLFSLFFFGGGGSFSYWLQDLRCSFFKSLLTGVSVKMAVALLIYILFLGPALGRGRMSSGEERRVSFFEVVVNGHEESIDVLGVHCYSERCCSHRRGRSTSIVRPHSFFVMKKSLLMG
jgi:hypothetical protein